MSLIESMLAIAILGIAGTALLLGIATSIDAADHAYEQVLAQGLAEQFLDELTGLRYAEPGAGPTGILGPESGEIVGQSRASLDDSDDYHGLSLQPPRDRQGLTYGRDSGTTTERHERFRLSANALARYRITGEVHYVDANDLTTPLATGQTSPFRAAHVRVFADDPGGKSRELINLRRILSYVPSM
jgi:type II secretory pathway pseudopilin PulG